MIKQELNVRVRLLLNNKVVYGQGISQLLQHIDVTKSIRLAAIEMGMTYRKALTIIKTAEKELEQPLLTKKIGGTDGGGSALTDFGKDFMQRFKLLEEDIANYANNKFKEYFNNFA